MRSKSAAVVLVLSSVAVVFGLTTVDASAAVMPAHQELAAQAAAFPIGLGFSTVIVLLGLIGLTVGLARLGRRSRAARRAAQAAAVGTAEEPVRTSA
jgi:hypothetical protein